MAHDLIDALVHNIMPTIDEMDDKSATIEAEALHEPEDTQLFRSLSHGKMLRAAGVDPIIVRPGH